MIEKHSLTLKGHRTSVSLEGVFWKHLKAIALRQNITLTTLVEQIDEARGKDNLSSALRQYVVKNLENNP